MFRIFKSGYGVDYLIPYRFGDGVWALVIGLFGVLMMVWLAVTAAPLMYLPVLAILAGFLVALYLGGGEGEARGIAAYYAAYPFFAYGWTGMCWAVFEAPSAGGVGVVGLLGWLLLAVLAVFLLVIPSFEAAGNSFGGLVIIPLAVLWVSAIINGIGAAEGTYDQTAARLVLYMFRVFGIAMAAALVVYIIFTVKEMLDKKDTIKNALGALLLFAAGCLIVYLLPLGATILDPVPLAGVVLVVFFVLSLLIYRRERKELLPGAQFAPLPLFISWVCAAFSHAAAIGVQPVVPLEAADRLMGVMTGPFMDIPIRAGSATLEGFGALFGSAYQAAGSLAARVFGSSLPAFEMPYLLTMICGFFAILLVMWLGTLIRDKIGN